MRKILTKIDKMFFLSMLLLCFLYRIVLHIQIPHIWIDDYNALAYHTIIDVGTLTDVGVCLFLTLFFIGLRFCLLRHSKYKIVRYFFSMIFFLFLFLFLFVVAFFYLINKKLYINLMAGINYTLIKLYLVNTFLLSDLFDFSLNLPDVLFLCSPFFLWLILSRITEKHLNQFIVFLLSITLCVFTFNMGFTLYFFKNLLIEARTLYINPLWNISEGFQQSFNKYNRENLFSLVEQKKNSRLIDPIFLTSQTTPALLSLPDNGRGQNIVIFVLESVGKDYVFSETSLKKVPMPFLKWLSEKGVWFENNYTGGNISPQGQFAILTGFYPNPLPLYYEMHANLNIPSLASLLGKKYSNFLVSSGNELYSAMGIIHKTFEKTYNANNIPHANTPLFFGMFLDEKTSYHFFLTQLKQVSSPFLAVYLSGASHFNYRDYSHEKNIEPDIKKPYSRYLNSLALVDDEIKQTYQTLKEKKLLNKTIFIVVSDHGEMFGQHHAYVHGYSLYENEIKVPLLIYAPQLFKAKHVTTVTSSVDIVPSLLDILRMPYKHTFQSKSYFSKKHRDNIFIYNTSENSVAAINMRQQKMIISFATGKCHSYNLLTDLQEQHPQPCHDKKQKEAILRFRFLQPNILLEIEKQKAEVTLAAVPAKQE